MPPKRKNPESLLVTVEEAKEEFERLVAAGEYPGLPEDRRPREWPF